jgi:nicotinate phosphoribosyltransferase
MVYKLVAVGEGPGPDAPLRPVAKRSVAKVSVGGRKSVHREYTDGVLTAETFTLDDSAGNVQVAAVRGGEVVHRPSLAEVREHAAEAIGTLPESAHAVAPSEPYLTVRPRGEQP